MTYQKGQSGNPAGKPKGANKTQQLRAKLMTAVPEILAALVDQAKAGDPTAARLILERCLPALRPVDMPTVLNLSADGGLADQGRAVLLALASGQLPVNQVAGILQGLGSLAKLIETDELERRIAALENKRG
jgi:hypothetical protein